MLTKRQSQAHRFIYEFIRDKGYSPTFKEIGESLGVTSSSAITKATNSLKAAGQIDWTPRKSRSFHVIKVPAPQVFKAVQWGLSDQLLIPLEAV